MAAHSQGEPATVLKDQTENEVPTPNTQSAQAKPSIPKAPRYQRPNYAQIHSKPLPLDVHPLPAFIPHNPLSIARIIFALLSDSLWPRSSHGAVHKAYFSMETQSIHVTDARSIRALWEQGFWGTGSLSRSEPRWLDQEKRKRGVEASQTSEEFTRQRRNARKQFKLERARKEREAIEEQQRSEGKLNNATGPAIFDKVGGPLEETLGTAVSLPHDGINEGTRVSSVKSTEAEFKTLIEPTSSNPRALSISSELRGPEEEIVDQEHLQLTMEEAFFLSYVLGVLELIEGDKPLHLSYLFRLYCTHSTFPISKEATHHLQAIKERDTNSLVAVPEDLRISPDNTFTLRYVVFHHFRSLGWVVRPGIKFAVDYLLYNRGPAFSHAEFAIMIIPSYSDPYWSKTAERMEQCKRKEHRDWWWLHRINRVQGQVFKTLVLVYVEIPPPWDSDLQGTGEEADIGSILKKYKVREFVLRRWTPNRNRD